MGRTKDGDTDNEHATIGTGTDSESGGTDFAGASGESSGADSGIVAAIGSVESDTGGADPYTAPSAEPAPIKRTRKPSAGGSGRGSRSTKKTPELALNKDARKLLARKVAGLHALVDVFTGMNRFEGGVFAITDDQSDQLTGAVMDVFEQYDITVSPKMAAWGNLCAVASMIYYPKIMIMKAVKREMMQQRQRVSDPLAGAGEQAEAGKMVFA